uniref:Uncharacterized protein n=1 Tax=Salix viminalis TaxID=40686 RepID=A0A6N2NCG6_SALVM
MIERLEKSEVLWGYIAFAFFLTLIITKNFKIKDSTSTIHVGTDMVSEGVFRSNESEKSLCMLDPDLVYK